MTIQYHSNLRLLMIGYGILGSGINVASGITIYSGTQPTAATITSNWSTYNSTNSSYLMHYSVVVWGQPVSQTAQYINITTWPASTNATNTGTGTWCIVWSMNPTGVQLASTTLPSTSFIVGPVTTLSGSGIVRFNNDTNFTSGVAKVIADGVMTAAMTA